MCYTNSPKPLKNNPMKGSSSSPRPARRTRTKTRKPKYLSLRRELSPSTSPDSSGNMTKNQLTLFPLHPENLFEEKDLHDHVGYFFEDVAAGATNLNGILGGGTSLDNSLSPSLTYAYGAQDRQGGSTSLEQAAFRQRERDVSEEKWVVYSEVVDKSSGDSGGGGDSRGGGGDGSCYHAPGLSLKLDYQEILDAWSNKGSLFIGGGDRACGGECPQTVPQQTQDSNCNMYMDVGLRCIGENVRQLWNVPEDLSSVTEDNLEGKIMHREARVMRYKEKRQSRLFSKRIRYEVRKINAEKRPRMKGRFVKRKSED